METEELAAFGESVAGVTARRWGRAADLDPLAAVVTWTRKEEH